MPPDSVARTRHATDIDRFWVFLGTAMLGIAIAGYLAGRAQLPIIGASGMSSPALEHELWGAMPSLLHCLAFCCFSYALLPMRLTVAFGCAFFWSVIHGLYESSLIGAIAAPFDRWQTTRDPVDALFAVLGAAIFLAIAALRLQHSTWRTPKHER